MSIVNIVKITGPICFRRCLTDQLITSKRITNATIMLVATLIITSQEEYITGHSDICIPALFWIQPIINNTTTTNRRKE